MMSPLILRICRGGNNHVQPQTFLAWKSQNTTLISDILQSNSRSKYCRFLRRIVEDYSQSMTIATQQAAYAVSQIDAISAFRPINGPIVHGKYHCIALF